jgi:uncharacterized protein YwqG
VKSLRNDLKEQSLGRFSGQIESAAKKSVRLSTEKRNAAPTNRLGGRPNLPRDLAWPTWREQPLGFVAQLDLPTLPRVRDLPLPRTGALFFFSEGGENAWGFSPKDRGSSRVLYSPTPLTDIPVRSFPTDLDEELRFKGVELSPQPPELTVPGIEDQALAGFGNDAR